MDPDWEKISDSCLERGSCWNTRPLTSFERIPEIVPGNSKILLLRWKILKRIQWCSWNGCPRLFYHLDLISVVCFSLTDGVCFRLCLFSRFYHLSLSSLVSVFSACDKAWSAGLVTSFCPFSRFLFLPPSLETLTAVSNVRRRFQFEILTPILPSIHAGRSSFIHKFILPGGPQ